MKCGKEGLFLKLDGYGFCNNCAAIAAREEMVDELERRRQDLEEELELLEEQRQQANQLAADADALLENAMEESKSAAFVKLEERKQSLMQQVQLLSEQSDAIERKAITAENRIAKAQRLYDSMLCAIQAFENAHSLDDLRFASILFSDIDGLDSFRPDLKCMSVKNLRSLFKKNEKELKKIIESYKSQYTTKTNAALYQLMTMALDAELTNILSTLKFGKLDDAINRVKAMTNKYYLIAQDGNQTIAPTLRKFIGQVEYFYTEAVKIEYEYYVQQERIKEEQRAIREQMRQEAEERRALEQQRKQVENEEKKYQQEINRIKEQMSAAADAEMDKLRKRLEELEGQLGSVSAKKAEIINLQNGKAGTVYVISNIGSFGENVFKVGMTRRLEPQERVNELGDASVPFPFDVHSFIFSDDAVGLEAELHRQLNSRRVNKVNLRKEFFSISLDELREMVERIDPTAPFTETALAEQYRQSLSMGDDVVSEIIADDDIDDESEAV